jgi:hypothetical protein
VGEWAGKEAAGKYGGYETAARQTGTCDGQSPDFLYSPDITRS